MLKHNKTILLAINHRMKNTVSNHHYVQFKGRNMAQCGFYLVSSQESPQLSEGHTLYLSV